MPTRDLQKVTDVAEKEYFIIVCWRIAYILESDFYDGVALGINQWCSKIKIEF